MFRSAFVFGVALFLAPIAAFATAPEAGRHEAAEFEDLRFPIRGFALNGNLVIATDRILNALKSF